MIPVKLVLKGLYSYRKEQTIDFGKLLEGQIFGIFGSVGSGKSSILEAISFALYFQTERLNVKDKRSYNMMNLKSDHLLIDFIFKAGKNEQEYRIKVEAKRKRNSDEVNAFSRKCYIKQGPEWIAEEINTEEIVGLNYENFRRTIIIPQGKFQEFLQLTESERVRMMKEIFQLSRFDLSDKVGILTSRNNHTRENILGELKAFEEVSPEIISEKEQEHKIAEASVKTLAGELEKQLQKEKELSRLHDSFQKLQDISERLIKLKSEEGTIKAKEQELKEYERLTRAFSKELHQKVDLAGKKDKVQQEIHTCSVQQKKAEQELTVAEESFRKHRQDYDKREDWKIQAQELEIYLKVVVLESSVKQLKEVLTDKKALLEKQTVEYKAYEEEEAEKAKQLESLQQDVPDLNELHNVKRWFERNREIQASVSELTLKQNELKKKLQDIQKSVDSCIHEHLNLLPQLATVPDHGDAILKGIIACIKGFDKELEALEKEAQELAAHQKLEEFVKELHDGNACPLCGSMEHPKLMDVAETGQQLEKIHTTRVSIAEKKQLSEDLYKTVMEYNSRLQSTKPFLSDNETQLKETMELLAGHQNQFVWTDFAKAKEEEIDKAIARAREVHEREKLLNREITLIRQKQQQLRKDKESIEQELNLLNQKLTATETEAGTLAASLKLIKREKADKMKAEDIRARAAELFRRYEEIEVLYRESEKKVSDLRNEKSRLEGIRNSQETQLKSLSEEYEAVELALENKRKDTLYSSLAEIEKILHQNLDTENELEKIQQFREQLFSLSEQEKDLKALLKETDFKPEIYQSLLTEIEELKVRHLQANEQLIKLVKEIEDLKNDLKRKKQLNQQLDAVILRGENLRTLTNLFRGNGFVNYISSKYLVNLCNAANDRFYKLTRQQLRLEISENNEFVVRDFLNNGKTRSVKTLSGGQTFQASLCLALALADSIRQQNNSEQNFFFLDEGFGSQDKESLGLVFDALKSLRKENRKVGIISHVEELQQEIDVALTVRNDEEEGSVVESSWG